MLPCSSWSDCVCLSGCGFQGWLEPCVGAILTRRQNETLLSTRARTHTHRHTHTDTHTHRRTISGGIVPLFSGSCFVSVTAHVGNRTPVSQASHTKFSEQSRVSVSVPNEYLHHDETSTTAMTPTSYTSQNNTPQKPAEPHPQVSR